MSSSVRGVGGWRFGGGEYDCGLWLDYGRDMLIKQHTLLHILFIFHDRRRDATKISDPGMRSYAIHTPFIRHFIRCSFFFQGNISLAEGGLESGKGFRIIGLFPILILGYGSRQLELRTICNGTSKVKYQKIHSDNQTQLDMFFFPFFSFSLHEVDYLDNAYVPFLPTCVSLTANTKAVVGVGAKLLGLE